MRKQRKEWLMKICQMVWTKENIPEEWKEAIILLMYKNEYKTMAVAIPTVASKVYT